MKISDNPVSIIPFLDIATFSFTSKHSGLFKKIMGETYNYLKSI